MNDVVLADRPPPIQQIFEENRKIATPKRQLVLKIKISSSEIGKKS